MSSQALTGAALSRARSRSRRALLQALYQWQLNAADAADIAHQFAGGSELKNADTEYFDELLRAITTDVEMLGAEVTGHLDRPADQLDPIEWAILLIGAYELKYRVDIPYRVVINEGVELAKRFGAEESHRYINAVLDRMAPALRAVEVKAGRRPD